MATTTTTTTTKTHQRQSGRQREQFPVKQLIHIIDPEAFEITPLLLPKVHHMSQNYRVRVTVELDVINAESESQARQTVFSLLSASPSPSKGRPASGPRATVTGVTIGEFHDFQSDSKSDVMY